MCMWPEPVLFEAINLCVEVGTHILVHLSVFRCTRSPQMFRNGGGALGREKKKKKKPAAGKSSPANAVLRDLQMGQRCHTAFPSHSTSPKNMMESGITLK